MDKEITDINEQIRIVFTRSEQKIKQLINELADARKELRELKDKQKYIIIKKRPIIK